MRLSPQAKYQRIFNTVSKNVKLSRRDYVTIIRLKTGYGTYLAHLTKLVLLVLVGGKQDPWIIFFGCMKNKHTKDKLIQKF